MKLVFDSLRELTKIFDGERIHTEKKKRKYKNLYFQLVALLFLVDFLDIILKNYLKSLAITNSERVMMNDIFIKPI